MSEDLTASPATPARTGRVWPVFLCSILFASAGWLVWPSIEALLPPVEQTFFYPLYLARQPAPVALPVPVAGVKASQISDSWGAPRGHGRQHQGIDIFAKRGTDVLSATEGIVTRIGTDPLGGKVVWVLGPAGQRHYYAHLDQYGPISVGQHVVQGTVLGKVGNTGNARSTPPHLHYGIYRNAALNPYPLLRAASPSVTGHNSKARMRNLRAGDARRQAGAEIDTRFRSIMKSSSG